MHLLLLFNMWTLWGVLVLIVHLASGKNFEVMSGFACFAAAVAGVLSLPVIYQAIATSI